MLYCNVENNDFSYYSHDSLKSTVEHTLTTFSRMGLDN